MAIEAMKEGAYDDLFKPLGLHQLRRVVGEAIEVARRMREAARGRTHQTNGTCRQIPSSFLPSHGKGLQGHRPRRCSGRAGFHRPRERTGKELVARAIHQHGSRAKAFFGPRPLRHPGDIAGERTLGA